MKQFWKDKYTKVFSHCPIFPNSKGQSDLNLNCLSTMSCVMSSNWLSLSHLIYNVGLSILFAKNAVQFKQLSDVMGK